MANTGPLKCKCCGDYFPRCDMKKTPAGTVYLPHTMNLVRQNQEKKKKQQASQHRKEKKIYYSSDLSYQEKLTQPVFNRMIVLLDAKLNCISCNRPPTKCKITAGHCRTVASMPSIRFTPIGCHGQCSGCNSGQQRKFKGDNATTQQKFKAELAVRYGHEALDWVNGPHPIANYTCDELIKLRAIFAAEVRHLEKGNAPTRDWRAIRNWREIIETP